MKLKYFFWILFIPLSGFGQKVPVCKKQSAENIHKIDLYKAYQKRNNFPLSMFAESLEYIPLKTNSDCLLSESIKRIIFTSNEIFIFDFNAVYRFNKSGKFVSRIGRTGRGPGECQKPRDMVLDTVNQQVTILDREKLVTYDFNGDFVRIHKLKAQSNSMLQTSSGDLLLNDMFYLYAKPGERYSMSFFSTDKERKISKIACEKKDKIPFCICDPIMYNYNKYTFVKDYWSDTIYQVIDPFNLKAYAAINTGKLKHRDNDDQSIVTGEKNPRDTWVVDITYISETDRFIFLTSNKGLFIYDKKYKETHCCNFRKENDQWHLFNNDLSPGPDLMSFIYVHPVSNSLLVTFNYAHDFFSEDGKLQKGLDKSLKNLKLDDNPVLVLVKFKN